MWQTPAQDMQESLPHPSHYVMVALRIMEIFRTNPLGIFQLKHFRECWGHTGYAQDFLLALYPRITYGRAQKLLQGFQGSSKPGWGASKASTLPDEFTWIHIHDSVMRVVRAGLCSGSEPGHSESGHGWSRWTQCPERIQRAMWVHLRIGVA